MNSKRFPRVVSFDKFLESVPGKITFSRKLNNDCRITTHHFPAHLIDSPAPATTGLTIGFINKGELLGNCKMNDNTYRKQQLIGGKTNIIIPPMHDICWNWKPIHSQVTYMDNVALHCPVQHFNKTMLETYDKDPNYLELLPQVSFDDQLTYELLRNIYRECQQDHFSGSVYIDTALHMLTVHVLTHYASKKLQTRKIKGSLSGSNQRRIKDFIRENLDQNISLQTLSSVANLSSYHFLRSFKKSMGLTPNQYLTQCRIAKAKTLLKNTQMPISKLAAKVGYKNAEHFRRQFKRMTGITPGQYRD